MQNNKAIEVLKSECYVLPFLDGDRAALINTALDVAIEALKQDVLDKIRVEIEAYQSDAFYPNNVMMNKRMVLEIIDKYKAESEGKK